VTKEVSHKKFSAKVHDLGFYELTIFNNEEILVSDIPEITGALRQVSGQKMPVLVVCPEFATTNSEVLKFLSKNENFPLSKGGAYVVYSVAQKLMANFYLKINTPERPTKFFTNKDEATIWLKQFI
jgi:hypothetical protein